MWYIYVLQSAKNSRHYTGLTDDLKRRFHEHNSGQGGEYTRDNRPYVLIYYEAYKHKKDAESAEKFYKSGVGREVIKNKLKNFLSQEK
ncbi:MAG TPA: GIY-YIG nuclease family protein [Patescibacteria group bacterium]|nr:GIY-YIG nuclease family protein [Patescibacteria group bacterium]